MEKEKQIEEMAKCLCGWSRGTLCILDDKDCNFKCTYGKLAEKLTAAGYRKASEVAEAVLNEALSKVQTMINSIEAQEESGNITEFNGGAKTSLEIVFKGLAELKKKYTEGKE